MFISYEKIALVTIYAQYMLDSTSSYISESADEMHIRNISYHKCSWGIHEC